MLQRLENNEAVLLMYLAGELPEDDRLDVEQQLRTDSGMRAALEDLKRLQDGVTAIFSESDGIALPPVTESARRAATTRRVSRAMVKYRMEEAQRPAAVEAPPQPHNWLLRLPRWAYPVAAAAVIIIAWVAYWGVSPGNDATSGPSGRQFVQHYDGGQSLPTPPSTNGSSDGNPVPTEQLELAAEVLPTTSSYPRAVDDSDRRLIAVSAGEYDVSTLFSTDPDSTP